jgi:hypothetical protein
MECNMAQAAPVTTPTPPPSQFVPEDFFKGHLKASGMFIDRFGNIQKRFSARVICEPANDGFILNEHFTFDDGKQETRIWHIQKASNQQYIGKTDDVRDKATGVLTNIGLHWRYDFYLELFGRRVLVNFNDKMIMQSSDVVLNHAKITKFGLKLGELFISFHRN